VPTDWFDQIQSLLASLPLACRFAVCACDWPGVEGLVARLVSYTSCDQVHPIPRPPLQIFLFKYQRWETSQNVRCHQKWCHWWFINEITSNNLVGNITNNLINDSIAALL